MPARIAGGNDGHASRRRWRSGSILLLIVLRALDRSASQGRIESGVAKSGRGLIIPWLLVRIQPGPLAQIDVSFQRSARFPMSQKRLPFLAAFALLFAPVHDPESECDNLAVAQQDQSAA